jgi:hypothetical protein
MTKGRARPLGWSTVPRHVGGPSSRAREQGRYRDHRFPRGSRPCSGQRDLPDHRGTSGDHLPNHRRAELLVRAVNPEELVGRDHSPCAGPSQASGHPDRKIFQLSSAITPADSNSCSQGSRLKPEPAEGQRVEGRCPGAAAPGVQRQPSDNRGMRPFGPIKADPQRFRTTCPPTRTTVPPPRASAGRGPPTREQE